MTKRTPEAYHASMFELVKPAEKQFSGSAVTPVKVPVAYCSH